MHWNPRAQFGKLTCVLHDTMGEIIGSDIVFPSLAILLLRYRENATKYLAKLSIRNKKKEIKMARKQFEYKVHNYNVPRFHGVTVIIKNVYLTLWQLKGPVEKRVADDFCLKTIVQKLPNSRIQACFSTVNVCSFLFFRQMLNFEDIHVGLRSWLIPWKGSQKRWL